MQHYTPEEWVDFIRGMGEERVLRAQQDHLDQGCAECAGVVRRLEAVAEAVRQDLRFPVPPHALFRAFAIFPPSRGESTAIAGIPAVARQIFDSWAAPAMQGVRSAPGGARQLSYRAGDLRVELSIEMAPRSASLVLTGQVHSEAGQERRGLTVRLMAGQRVLADGTTNEFGEFVLKGKPAEKAHLSILEPKSKMQLLVPLPETKAFEHHLDAGGSGRG